MVYGPGEHPQRLLPTLLAARHGSDRIPLTEGLHRRDFPFVDDEVVLGRAFEGLRRLSETLRAGSSAIGGELSMGMTNDLEIAIREGSTMVRIGTALFGQRGTT